MTEADPTTAARWRLVLGRFAEDRLAQSGGAGDRLGAALDFLYNREAAGRGLRFGRGGPGDGSGTGGRLGGDGASVLEIPTWLREVRELFPADVCEVVTRHALERYGLTELVTDPETLRRLEPSYELLKSLMAFKGLMQGEALDLARTLIRRIVEDLRRKLATELRPVLSGRLDRNRRSRLKIARNLDLKRTVRANLRHAVRPRPDAGLVLLARDLVFRARVSRHLPWHVVMLVDCSGSMADSVIHAAVMAGIFAGLPQVSVKLAAFDTALVDLSAQVDDPAAVLMAVQLGGGTDIAGAMGWAMAQVEHPSRTIVVLVSDFEENGPIAPVCALVRKLRSGGTRVLGLAALDQKATPVFSRDNAQALVDAGAEVAAMTPRHLAEWLGGVLN